MNLKKANAMFSSYAVAGENILIEVDSYICFLTNSKTYLSIFRFSYVK